MYLVAVNYAPGAPLDLQKLQEFAGLLGRTAYELRPRLSIPAGGPAVVASFAQQDQAQELEEALGGIGFEATVLAEEEAEPEGSKLEVRSFGWDDSCLWGESRQGQRHSVPWGEIYLLLRGISFSSETQTETQTQKKFSMGRAVMSGGLVRNKKITTSRETTTQSGQGMLYVYAEGAPMLAFLEHGLLWESLGEDMKPSRSANFLFLCQALRDRSCEAIYDDRFLRRAGQKQLLGQFLEPEEHLHIASTLLAQALTSR